MKKGFTFVEVVFAVSIFLVVVMSVYEGYRGLYKALSVARLKVIVSSLINEKFEIARNLPYTDVGVSGGVPSGKLMANQIVYRDGVGWNVVTVVQNVDDPFDGVSPVDTKPADYKLVEITASCLTCTNLGPTKIVGRIAPRNLEP